MSSSASIPASVRLDMIEEANASLYESCRRQKRQLEEQQRRIESLERQLWGCAVQCLQACPGLRQRAGYRSGA